MDKIDKLLAVSNIASEERQIKALYDLGYTDYFAECSCGRDGKTWQYKTSSLADLAFRLRDEAVQHFEEWRKAVVDVASCNLGIDWESYWDYAEAIIWFVRLAQPIHWIISSLIAKELSNENKSKKT